MALDDWQGIIPRHGRLLKMLREQKVKDPFGSIGWGGLRDEKERFSDRALFDPLLERGLIEDCKAYRGAGHLFVRITEFGELCLDFGLMPKHPVKSAEARQEFFAAAVKTMEEKNAKVLEGV